LGEQPRIEDGGVSWEGDARSVMRANLWLRTASRVLVRVATFKATAFFEVEKRAKSIPWRRFVGENRSVEFRVTAKKSRLYHSDAIAERLAKAVRAALSPTQSRATAKPKRPLPPRVQPAAKHPILFVVRVFHDEFTISADTSGDLLHMRGYRLAAGKAPLRETLGAALLLASQWTGDTALLDPFCGSGTIPIEGALIARRLPPGLDRDFEFMNWPDYDAASWRRLTNDARAASLASSPVPIAGSDRDAGAIAFSRENAQRAGVAGDIVFETRAISNVDASGPPGLLATNPPYGVRVSERATVRNLYARLGQVIRDRLDRWDVAMFSSDTRLAAQVGLEFRELFRTTNGGLRVSALHHRGVN